MSLNELKKLQMNIKTGSTQIHNVKNPIKKKTISQTRQAKKQESDPQVKRPVDRRQTKTGGGLTEG